MRLARGRYLPSGALEFRIIRKDAGPARISFIAPKNSIPLSVNRHMYKRLIYGAFLSSDKRYAPFDLIIRPGRGWKPSLPSKTEVRRSIREILNKV